MTDYSELVKALLSASTVSTAWEKLMRNAAAAIEDLRADVKRLKECNDELREAQTYIDHYGDKWMTSAKDVPTSAYNHGYMDGRDEAMAKMEVGVSQTEVWCFAQAIMEKYHADAYLKITVEREQR